MATRRHGQHGRLYVDLSQSANGSAEPVTTLTQWQINFSVDRVDVTAFDDSNKVYVAGKPDSQMSFQGFLDVDSNQLYHAAAGGQARKFYLYPDRSNDPNKYWFGTAIFDFSAQGSVSGAVEVSGSGAAASNVGRVWS